MQLVAANRDDIYGLVREFWRHQFLIFKLEQSTRGRDKHWKVQHGIHLFWSVRWFVWMGIIHLKLKG